MPPSDYFFDDGNLKFVQNLSNMWVIIPPRCGADLVFHQWQEVELRMESESISILRDNSCLNQSLADTLFSPDVKTRSLHKKSIDAPKFRAVIHRRKKRNLNRRLMCTWTSWKAAYSLLFFSCVLVRDLLSKPLPTSTTHTHIPQLFTMKSNKKHEWIFVRIYY